MPGTAGGHVDQYSTCEVAQQQQQQQHVHRQLPVAAAAAGRGVVPSEQSGPVPGAGDHQQQQSTYTTPAAAAVDNLAAKSDSPVCIGVAAIGGCDVPCHPVDVSSESVRSSLDCSPAEAVSEVSSCCSSLETEKDTGSSGNRKGVFE